MTLSEYLKKTGISYRSFSVKVDIDASQLNKYAKGAKAPSIKNAYKIYLATKKQVGLEDWNTSKEDLNESNY